MSESHQFTEIRFLRFKAFDRFTINLRHFNILVGPNNAGKSTILAAFRILAAGMRRASRKSPEPLMGPNGRALGHVVDLGPISVAAENIFHNYDESEPATVTFKLSNKNKLTLYFPSPGVCRLFPEDTSKAVKTPKDFRTRFNCTIGFVPILGPVEHNEQLYEREAARRALFNYRAARNFRNIWHHYPEKFDELRRLLRQTWPGMDIERPEIDYSGKKPVLHMFCPEDRIPREIFWSGFGFQVWCQMLTHLVQSSDSSLFLIDEPDIYLHSDLQRQLLGLLRNLGPDILIATHSTEIVTEAEPDDILLVDKSRGRARRIKDPGELSEVFSSLGSNLNPILTQLAKTRRVVFVEGKDFQILGRLARKLGLSELGNRSGFALVPVEGFNPDRIKSLKRGMEATLGSEIRSAAVLDKDYRSRDECGSISDKCRDFCDLVAIHQCKEVENLLLVPSAIDRAASRRVADRAKRTGDDTTYTPIAQATLEAFAADKKSFVTSRYLASRRQYQRAIDPSEHEASVNEAGLEEFEANWADDKNRFRLVPGKEALAFVNQRLQEEYKVSITPTGIVDAMQRDEIPDQASGLLEALDDFAKS